MRSYIYHLIDLIVYFFKFIETFVQSKIFKKISTLETSKFRIKIVFQNCWCWIAQIQYMWWLFCINLLTIDCIVNVFCMCLGLNSRPLNSFYLPNRHIHEKQSEKKEVLNSFFFAMTSLRYDSLRFSIDVYAYIVAMFLFFFDWNLIIGFAKNNLLVTVCLCLFRVCSFKTSDFSCCK